MQTCKNLTKNRTKTSAFTTLGISQRKKIDDYQNIYSVNHLYLIVANVSGYIKEKGKNKYLVF